MASQRGWGEGATLMFFNLMAHKNVLQSLREVGMSTRFLGPSPHLSHQNLWGELWGSVEELVMGLAVAWPCVQRIEKPLLMEMQGPFP